MTDNEKYSFLLLKISEILKEKEDVIILKDCEIDTLKKRIEEVETIAVKNGYGIRTSYATSEIEKVTKNIKNTKEVTKGD